mmetsp:Transcript_31275/g.72943  ORF Transcript_31275/g.72943 Transcript_31275/m.72943 type:complete len:345 (+) Transcript_31275:18-1052(+)
MGSHFASAAAADDDRQQQDHSLVSTGEEFIRKLKDPAVESEELQQIVQDAVARKEFCDILAARDERGRSPLHVSASRGDLHLCKAMLDADPSLVNALDKYQNTPLMDASLIGRSLIVKELLAHAADVSLKNSDLMTALQLACVNEGAGNGDVIEELVASGADPAALCWQTTPLMAAADSGHLWGVEKLIDLGADPWQQNGSGFTALDYARDLETAQMLYDVMQGDRLHSQPAPRFDAQRLFKSAEERRARLHRAAREVSLEDAFATLEVPNDWLQSFRESGDHFNDIRKAWRQICLRCHPDKQPEGLEDDQVAEWTAQFQSAVAAFEAIEKHYRSVSAELLPDA